MKKILITLIVTCVISKATAQVTGFSGGTLKNSRPDTTRLQPLTLPELPNNSRKWLAGGIALAFMGGSLLFLTHSNNYTYHKEFKTVNDSRAWLQMDKSEHMFMTYGNARLFTSLGKQAGFTPKRATLVGSAGSLLFLTIKEFLDGHNKVPGTGWSWMDMGANAAGLTLFAAQEILWEEQKVYLKFSALPKRYEPTLNARANILFGNSIPERILKDYNAQTYWLSFNFKNLGATAGVPAWLNLALGYGGQNLFGPEENLGYANGQVVFDRTDLHRYRQWYISPDIDFTKIKTNSRLVASLLSTLNLFKAPLPALEFSNNKIRGHWLIF